MPLPGPDKPRGSSLGEAVLAARQVLVAEKLPDWDVFQLYGDPDFRLWGIEK